jgi:hypothetical protein
MINHFFQEYMINQIGYLRRIYDFVFKCEKHDRLPVEGFLRSVNISIQSESFGKKPLKGLSSDGYTKVTKLL